MAPESPKEAPRGPEPSRKAQESSRTASERLKRPKIAPRRIPKKLPREPQENRNRATGGGAKRAPDEQTVSPCRVRETPRSSHLQLDASTPHLTTGGCGFVPERRRRGPFLSVGDAVHTDSRSRRRRRRRCRRSSSRAIVVVVAAVVVVIVVVVGQPLR